jgi:hypothetical protein
MISVHASTKGNSKRRSFFLRGRKWALISFYLYELLLLDTNRKRAETLSIYEK